MFSCVGHSAVQSSYSSSHCCLAWSNIQLPFLSHPPSVMDFTDIGSNGQHSSWLTSIWETLIGRPQELPDTVVSKPALPRDTVTVASTSPTDSIASVLPADTITSMAKLDTVVTPDNLVLPPELLLRCFSYMSLKCLISPRCVCSDWRQLIPQSDLHPTRRRFLELYDKMLANPLFLQWITSNPSIVRPTLPL